MTKIGKDMFGNEFNIKAEVTNGHCPVCETPTIFVSIQRNFYRCMHCGGDTEQKVNGVIKYIPAIRGKKNAPILTQDNSKENG